jgi:hypothetical protein
MSEHWKAETLGDRLEGFLREVTFDDNYGNPVLHIEQMDGDWQMKTFTSGHKLIREKADLLEYNVPTRIVALQPGPTQGFTYGIFQQLPHYAPEQPTMTFWRQVSGYLAEWKPIDFLAYDLCKHCKDGSYYIWESCPHKQPPKTWVGVIETARAFGGAPIAVVLLKSGRKIGLPI